MSHGTFPPHSNACGYFLPQLVIVVVATHFILPSALAQRNFDAVTIDVIHVAENVHMLVGMGGNIGVSVGEDGVLMVDDQFAPLTEKILAAVATLTDKPVQFVVNTHFHGDHVGGNENLGKAGAIIVAHANVRARMAVEQRREPPRGPVPAAPPDALPVVTFKDGLSFHWNGDRIDVLHYLGDDMGAHTDGDAVVHFVGANVIHMGDTYFNGMYPFIDIASGGSVTGLLSFVDRALELADDDTKIIPGHGPLSDKAELVAYRTMLADIHEAVAALRAEGLSLEEVVAQAPSGAYDAAWGGGFISPAAMVGAVYRSAN